MAGQVFVAHLRKLVLNLTNFDLSEFLIFKAKTLLIIPLQVIGQPASLMSIPKDFSVCCYLSLD